MTDRELNLKMLDLCGERYVPVPGAKILYIAKSDQGGTTKWDPVKSWDQVNRYVIPALRGMGLEIGIHYVASETFVVIDVSEPCESGYWAISGGTEIPNPSPRFVCEAALQAANKLETDSAK